MVQPGTVATKWVFERHDITILYRGAIESVLGVDLECCPVVVQPMVSCPGAGDPVKTKNQVKMRLRKLRGLMSHMRDNEKN